MRLHEALRSHGSRRGAVAYLLSLGVVSGIVLAACGGSAKANPNVINATESNFEIKLDRSTIAPGQVTFNVTNDGPAWHEFVVFRTDLQQTGLPVKNQQGNAQADQVVEEAPGVNHIDEIAEFAPGQSKQLTVNLQPGHYVIICNIPNHYVFGMHAELTVTGQQGPDVLATLTQEAQQPIVPSIQTIEAVRSQSPQPAPGGATPTPTPSPTTTPRSTTPPPAGTGTSSPAVVPSVTF